MHPPPVVRAQAAKRSPPQVQAFFVGLAHPLPSAHSSSARDVTPCVLGGGFTFLFASSPRMRLKVLQEESCEERSWSWVRAKTPRFLESTCCRRRQLQAEAARSTVGPHGPRVHTLATTTGRAGSRDGRRRPNAGLLGAALPPCVRNGEV